MAYETLKRLYEHYESTGQKKRAEEMKAKMEMKAPAPKPESKPKKESKKEE